jgi:hypothetical protein
VRACVRACQVVGEAGARTAVCVEAGAALAGRKRRGQWAGSSSRALASPALPAWMRKWSTQRVQSGTYSGSAPCPSARLCTMFSAASPSWRQLMMRGATWRMHSSMARPAWCTTSRARNTPFTPLASGSQAMQLGGEGGRGEHGGGESKRV